MDEGKFQALLTRHDFGAAERMIRDSDLPEARRRELLLQVEERRKRFWRDFFQADLYAGIPAVIILGQPLLWALSVLSRHVPAWFLMSAAVTGGMLWFYGRRVHPLWRRLRRPGGMAAFERDRKRLGWVLWHFGMAWSLLFTGILGYYFRIYYFGD